MQPPRSLPAEPKDGVALANAVQAASNEANAAAPGAKPKKYTIKLSCNITYGVPSDLSVGMHNGTAARARGSISARYWSSEPVHAGHVHAGRKGRGWGGGG